MVILSVSAILVVVAWTVHDVQAWLENWDYRRHCND